MVKLLGDRRTHSIVAMLVLFMVALAAVTAQAQAGIDASQLEALQRLSPDERAALLQALGNAPVSSPSARPSPGRFAQPPQRLSPRVPVAAEVPAEPKLESGSTLVLKATLPEDMTPLQMEEFKRDINRARLIGAHAFRLDQDGRLELPGIGMIPLAGLTGKQAAVRLEAEPLLSKLDIEVTVLPLTPIGTDALKPFGYSLFNTRIDAFGIQPPASIPVPRDYVLGPGDSLRVQLYGNDNYEVELTITPEGTINFPKIGPQPVAGLTYGEVKNAIEKRIYEQLIGTQAAVTMGQLKSMRVFIVGEVKRPGAYDISSLSRVSNALFLSGGIDEMGSLRKIRLKRKGKVVRTIDLYALLLHGDTRNDAQLQPDDVILVPPVGVTAAIDGEVKRPAIYELGREQSLGELIELAGGLKATADKRRVQRETINEAGARSVDTVDISEPGGLATRLQAGDILRVFPVLDEVEDAVTLAGHVTRPGIYEWQPGMRISDLLLTQLALKPHADLGYVLIRRENGPERRISVMSADLMRAQAAPGTAADPLLQPRDRVMVFEQGVSRSAAVKKILDELQAQATTAEPFQAASIYGEVHAPGVYPLEPAMRVGDLLRAGGGLKPSAYATQAGLTRYRVGPDGEREIEVLEVDIAAALRGDPAADLPLQPYDVLSIRRVPEWAESLNVELIGEVRFPGVYPVRRGESLSSVIERAGGLTDMAFPEGSVFTREFLREREAEQLAVLHTRLKTDIATLAVQRAQTPDGKAAEALSVGQSLLIQLENTEPQGRLVIDLPAIISHPGDPRYDVQLRDGDKLVIPPRSQEVMVLGEVQYATSHRHDPEFDRDQYIRLSGGLTPRADKKRIYIVRANGAVVAGKSSLWFRNKGTIQPGDTVVVPLDTDRLPKLAQWASITQILYNMAIAVAAVNSF